MGQFVDVGHGLLCKSGNGAVNMATTTKAPKKIKSKYAYTDEGKQHLHTLNGKPLLGTSTVVKIIGTGGAFSWWASGKAVEKLGWLKRLDVRKSKPEEILKRVADRWQAAATALLAYRTMSVEDYQKLLDDAYRAHEDSKKESAETGVDMHAELEKYVKECIDSGGKPIVSDTAQVWQVDVFAKWAIENVEKFIWSEAHCYSEKLWCGGISDAGALMKDSKIAVIDFKSSKDAYYSQFVQAAGYAQLIEENGLLDAQGNSTLKPKGKITALYVVPFGAEDITPRAHYDVEGRKADFACAVQLYKNSQLMSV